LQSRVDDLSRLDTEVLAVSVDTQSQSREIAEAYGIEFRLLSDPELRVIDQFGVRHPDGGLDGDIARPAVFILDREGRVVWRDLTENWRVRVRPEPLLERLAGIP
jgi:peroxiredoxin